MIIKDGVSYIAGLALLCPFFYFVHPVLALIPASLLVFVTFFFRNPNRQINVDNRHILSPADGTVFKISELEGTGYFEGKAIKISIFLSLLDVHINRSPINGIITETKYRNGKFLPAFKSHASDINERNTIVLENNLLKVVVHQITGFIARRIVFYNKKGDYLDQGQIFGLIKFGSCTEIIFPAEVNLTVKNGQKVKAGITVLGVLKDE